MVRFYVAKKRKPWVPKYRAGQLCTAGLVVKPHPTRRKHYWVKCRKCGKDRLVREQKLFIIQFCKACTGKENWKINPNNPQNMQENEGE